MPAGKNTPKEQQQLAGHGASSDQGGNRSSDGAAVSSKPGAKDTGGVPVITPVDDSGPGGQTSTEVNELTRGASPSPSKTGFNGNGVRREDGWEDPLADIDPSVLNAFLVDTAENFDKSTSSAYLLAKELDDDVMGFTMAGNGNIDGSSPQEGDGERVTTLMQVETALATTRSPSSEAIPSGGSSKVVNLVNSFVSIASALNWMNSPAANQLGRTILKDPSKQMSRKKIVEGLQKAGEFVYQHLHHFFCFCEEQCAFGTNKQSCNQPDHPSVQPFQLKQFVRLGYSRSKVGGLRPNVLGSRCCISPHTAVL